MMGDITGFDWDEGNRAKCGKHGVTVSEIEGLFMADPRIAPDPRHSYEEDRFIAVGRTKLGRPLFVAFTIRPKGDKQLIRPVSARYMHKKEIAGYEKEGSKAEER
jgi:uncharacterized DUF497 family protein